MTKCPCSRSVCRYNSSFFYKVLSSLKQLQSNKKYSNGACLEDIAKFMEKTYVVNGDIVSQVENALCVAENSRFIVKKKNLYALVCPAAALQFTPDPCIKPNLERIQEVFNAKWYADGDTKKCPVRHTKRSSYSPPHFLPSNDVSGSPSQITKSKTGTKKRKRKRTSNRRQRSKSRSRSKSPVPKSSKTRKSSKSSNKPSIPSSFISCECEQDFTQNLPKPVRSRSKKKSSKKRRRTSSPSTSKKKKKRKPSRSRSSSKKKKYDPISSDTTLKKNEDKSRSSPSPSNNKKCHPCTTRNSCNEIMLFCPGSDSDSSEC